MSVYLETNALMKLTSYKCKESVWTSIFSIFEILSGLTEKEYEARKACLRRIKEEKMEIKGPMPAPILMNLFEIPYDAKYNESMCEMIIDMCHAVLENEDYSKFIDRDILFIDKINIRRIEDALAGLKKLDDSISGMTKNLDRLFEGENKDYISQIYDTTGIKGLADYFWMKFYDNQLNEERLSHAEPFAGTDVIATSRQKMKILFSKYNFKLFLRAQAAIFAVAYFINGNSQDKNNPSDLAHLLYLDENDIFVSNDKLFQRVLEACPEFKLIVLPDKKNLADLI